MCFKLVFSQNSHQKVKEASPRLSLKVEHRLNTPLLKMQATKRPSSPSEDKSREYKQKLKEFEDYKQTIA